MVRIHVAVDEQLVAKGMTQSAVAPNLVVATHVVTHEQKKIVAPGFGFGPWGWGWGGPGAMIDTYLQGTLIVDLYDARRWFGVVSRPTRSAIRRQKTRSISTRRSGRCSKNIRRPSSSHGRLNGHGCGPT